MGTKQNYGNKVINDTVKKTANGVIKKTNKDLYNLYNACISAQKCGTTAFKAMICRNIRLFEPEIEMFKELETEINELIKPYNEKYYAILNEYGTVSGERIVIEKESPNYTVAFKKIKELETECAEDISLHKLKMQEYEEFLNSFIAESYSFIEIPEKLIPNEIELKIFFDFGIVK